MNKNDFKEYKGENLNVGDKTYMVLDYHQIESIDEEFIVYRAIIDNTNYDLYLDVNDLQNSSIMNVISLLQRIETNENNRQHFVYVEFTANLRLELRLAIY
ncbi:hypothetical protein EDF68_105213 [Ochrobactrum sp. BH3]|nr:hypothetical protein EDF68_105213 [Ochrobactrum sp. BH3]